MPPWILLVTSYYCTWFRQFCKVNILCRAKGSTAYMRFFFGGGVHISRMFQPGVTEGVSQPKAK